MLSQLHEFIAEKQLIKHGDRILLAVSGGIDSMVMAHLFMHLPYETGIAHCNFTLRGEESDGDEKLVQQFSEENNIPFHLVRFQTKEHAKKNGLSVQMAARELRYSWFENIRKENGYDSIAVAHNLNDNIETLIINLIRGTGPAGLSGMRPVSGRIIRPLLFATRESISGYCVRHGIRYREDRSNADTKYTRNKIRHLVIPVLKEINPSIETTLAEEAERFAGINEIMKEYISRLNNEVSVKNDDLTVFGIRRLKDYLHNKTILFELFRPFGIGSQQIDDLLKVINGRTGGLLFTGTHRIIRNREEIIVSAEKNISDNQVIINGIEELKDLPGFRSAEKIVPDENFVISADPSAACLDLEKLVFPLTLRKWHAGDHFFPLGMNHSRKLSDYFIDKKYSIPVKENKRILESDSKIVWIVGDRIDNRFKITGETREALVIRLDSDL